MWDPVFCSLTYAKKKKNGSNTTKNQNLRSYVSLSKIILINFAVKQVYIFNSDTNMMIYCISELNDLIKILLGEGDGAYLAAQHI